MKDGFALEPPNIRCLDVWPPNACTGAAMAAYRQMEQEGSLRLLRVERHPSTGRTLVDYLSAIPHEWMLEQLGRRKRETELSGQQMRMEGTR